MKKSILIAALGLFSLSTMAQDAKPEEGQPMLAIVYLQFQEPYRIRFH